MAEHTKIEWTDHTANPWWGCTKVHAGCDHCYAESTANRWNFDVWGNDKPRRLIESFFKDLATYQRKAAIEHSIKSVFVASMSDIFEKSMPLVNAKGEPALNMMLPGNPQLFTDDIRQRLFAEISGGFYNNLRFLFLTKRPSNINKMIPFLWLENPPSNVWFGTSPVDQKTAFDLIPQLLKVNGNRFLSIEPQLDDIDLTPFFYKRELTDELTQMIHPDDPNVVNAPSGKIHWVIQGGESGPGKRPFKLKWAYTMQEQCFQGGVPYFFKQINKVDQPPADLIAARQFPWRRNG